MRRKVLVVFLLIGLAGCTEGTKEKPLPRAAEDKVELQVPLKQEDNPK